MKDWQGRLGLGGATTVIEVVRREEEWEVAVA